MLVADDDETEEAVEQQQDEAPQNSEQQQDEARLDVEPQNNEQQQQDEHREEPWQGDAAPVVQRRRLKARKKLKRARKPMKKKKTKAAQVPSAAATTFELPQPSNAVATIVPPAIPLGGLLDPVCSNCKCPLDVLRCKIGGKGQRPMKCNRCNVKTTQLIRLYGSWPPPSFAKQDADWKVKFWQAAQDVAGGPAALDAFVVQRLTIRKLEEEVSTFGGEYLPLSVHKTRGFDCDMIVKNCKDTGEHDVLGLCYRVSIRSAYSRTIEQMVREELNEWKAKQQLKTVAKKMDGVAGGSEPEAKTASYSSSTSSNSSSSSSSPVKHKSKSKKSKKRNKKVKKHEKGQEQEEGGTREAG